MSLRAAREAAKQSPTARGIASDAFGVLAMTIVLVMLFAASTRHSIPDASDRAGITRQVEDEETSLTIERSHEFIEKISIIHVVLNATG